MEALQGEGITKAVKASVPSGQIVAAFRVQPDAAKNKHWWENRMRHAKRYELKDARAVPGKAKTPSRWYPLQIALWLIDKRHLSAEKVRLAVEKHFPQIDSSLL